MYKACTVQTKKRQSCTYRKCLKAAADNYKERSLCIKLRRAMSRQLLAIRSSTPRRAHACASLAISPCVSNSVIIVAYCSFSRFPFILASICIMMNTTPVPAPIKAACRYSFKAEEARKLMDANAVCSSRHPRFSRRKAAISKSPGNMSILQTIPISVQKAIRRNSALSSTAS